MNRRTKGSMSYRLTKEEPIEKESITARLLANQVA